MTLTFYLLTFYLAFGIINVVVAWDRGLLMIGTPGNTFEGVIEALLYVLLWPLQVLFAAFVGVYNFTSWVLGKVMG